MKLDAIQEELNQEKIKSLAFKEELEREKSRNEEEFKIYTSNMEELQHNFSQVMQQFIDAKAESEKRAAEVLDLKKTIETQYSTSSCEIPLKPQVEDPSEKIVEDEVLKLFFLSLDDYFADYTGNSKVSSRAFIGTFLTGILWIAFCTVKMLLSRKSSEKFLRCKRENFKYHHLIMFSVDSSSNYESSSRTI